MHQSRRGILSIVTGLSVSLGHRIGKRSLGFLPVLLQARSSAAIDLVPRRTPVLLGLLADEGIPGSELEMIIKGLRLAAASRVAFRDSSIKAEIIASDQSFLTIRIDIGPGAQVGRAGFRVIFEEFVVDSEAFGFHLIVRPPDRLTESDQQLLRTRYPGRSAGAPFPERSPGMVPMSSPGLLQASEDAYDKIVAEIGRRVEASNYFGIGGKLL